MRYSLLSRFRGALLGSLLGEVLVSGGELGEVLGGAALTIPNASDVDSSLRISDWSQISTYGTESLIRCGRLDLEDWLCYSGMRQPSLLLLKTAASSSEVAVATLPIALFFHEDQVKLQQQLLQATAVWQQESETSEGAFAVALAIAFTLTEKLNLATLIPQILTSLGRPETTLVQQLEQVQTLLEQGAGLETTLTQLHREAQSRGELLSSSDTSIALAFYCFLSTPEDFRLCVGRAARTGSLHQTTSAIAGALSGAYNGMMGIPISWRLAANRISTGIQRRQLADHLFSVWSGVYAVSAIDQISSVAVAAPWVIQPR